MGTLIIQIYILFIIRLIPYVYKKILYKLNQFATNIITGNYTISTRVLSENRTFIANLIAPGFLHSHYATKDEL